MYPGGSVYLTTPNLVWLRVIALMLVGETYLPAPEDFFSEIDYRNEAVHRREYILREIKEAAVKAGLEIVDSGYVFKRSHTGRDWQLWLLYPSSSRYLTSVQFSTYWLGSPSESNR